MYVCVYVAQRTRQSPGNTSSLFNGVASPPALPYKPMLGYVPRITCLGLHIECFFVMIVPRHLDVEENPRVLRVASGCRFCKDRAHPKVTTNQPRTSANPATHEQHLNSHPVPIITHV